MVSSALINVLARPRFCLLVPRKTIAHIRAFCVFALRVCWALVGICRAFIFFHARLAAGTRSVVCIPPLGALTLGVISVSSTDGVGITRSWCFCTRIEWVAHFAIPSETGLAMALCTNRVTGSVRGTLLAFECPAHSNLFPVWAIHTPTRVGIPGDTGFCQRRIPFSKFATGIDFFFRQIAFAHFYHFAH